MTVSYFRQPRNVELSTLKYLEDNLTIDWSGVTLIKTFKDAYVKNITLPIVCVRLIETTSVRLEIGSKTLDDRYLLAVDVFSTSDAMRIDLSYYVKDKLKDGWDHYDHSHTAGDKSSLDLTLNGRDFITDFITDGKVELDDIDDPKDRYRHQMVFEVKKNT